VEVLGFGETWCAGRKFLEAAFGIDLKCDSLYNLIARGFLVYHIPGAFLNAIFCTTSLLGIEYQIEFERLALRRCRLSMF
jgi:hypothetical protein